MFKSLGLGLILASWGVGWYIITKWRDASLPTLSKHAAQSRVGLFVFGGTMTVLGLALYFWLLSWFVPHLRLGSLFVGLLSLTVVCQLIAGFVPDVLGWRRMVHGTAAYTMAVLFLPLGLLVALSPEIGPIVRMIMILGLLYMAWGITYVALLRKVQRYYLLFQMQYVVIFELIILAGAYL